MASDFVVKDPHHSALQVQIKIYIQFAFLAGIAPDRRGRRIHPLLWLAEQIDRRRLVDADDTLESGRRRGIGGLRRRRRQRARGRRRDRQLRLSRWFGRRRIDRGEWIDCGLCRGRRRGGLWPKKGREIKVRRAGRESGKRDHSRKGGCGFSRCDRRRRHTRSARHVHVLDHSDHVYGQCRVNEIPKHVYSAIAKEGVQAR